MAGKKCTINFSEKGKNNPGNHRPSDQTCIICKDFMNTENHAVKCKAIQSDVFFELS